MLKSNHTSQMAGVRFKFDWPSVSKADLAVPRIAAVMDTGFVTAASHANPLFVITGLNWVGQDGFIIDLAPSSSLMGAATNFMIIDGGHGISFNFGVDLFPALASETLDIELTVIHVPEPGTLAIMGLGLLGLGAVRRRRLR